MNVPNVVNELDLSPHICFAVRYHDHDGNDKHPGGVSEQPAFSSLSQVQQVQELAKEELRNLQFHIEELKVRVSTQREKVQVFDSRVHDDSALTAITIEKSKYNELRCALQDLEREFQVKANSYREMLLVHERQPFIDQMAPLVEDVARARKEFLNYRYALAQSLSTPLAKLRQLYNAQVQASEIFQTEASKRIAPHERTRFMSDLAATGADVSALTRPGIFAPSSVFQDARAVPLEQEESDERLLLSRGLGPELLLVNEALREGKKPQGSPLAEILPTEQQERILRSKPLI